MDNDVEITRLGPNDEPLSTKDGRTLTDCGVKSVSSLFSVSLEHNKTDKANTWQLKMRGLEQMKMQVSILKQPSEENWLFIHAKLVTAVTHEY